MSNTIINEAQGDTWSNTPVYPESLKESPGELALQIKSSAQPGKKLFAAL